MSSNFISIHFANHQRIGLRENSKSQVDDGKLMYLLFYVVLTAGTSLFSTTDENCVQESFALRTHNVNSTIVEIIVHALESV